MGSLNGYRVRGSLSMAGWSMVAEDDTVEHCKTLKNLDPNKSPKDLKQSESRESIFEKEVEELVFLFSRLLEAFLEEFCTLDSLRPLPPMTGDGRPIDLFKLFLSVSHKGGFEAVSELRLWGVVAQESGLGFTRAASAKLIYAKYLDALARWLNRVVAGETDCNGLELSGISGNLKIGLEGFLCEVKRRYKLRKGDNSTELGVELKWFISKMKRKYDKYHDDKKLLDTDDLKKVQESNMIEERLEQPASKEKPMILDSGSQDCSSPGKRKYDAYHSDKESLSSDAMEVQGSKTIEVLVDSGSGIEASPSPGKRKRECSSQTLKWLSKVAKDPCNPSIGCLPEISKWESYGSEEPWKEILLFRASRRKTDLASEKNWQKLQRMHPCMYDDSLRPTYNLRQRLSSDGNHFNEKTSGKSKVSSGDGTTSQSSDDEEIGGALVGPEYQAEVPEWTDITSESDSKWLGTRIWPLSKEQNAKRGLIELERIGKGRQDRCGCASPGSIECVRYHIKNKNEKLREELGPPFYIWRFDVMGEGTLKYLTGSEHKKIMNVMTSPPLPSPLFFEQAAKILATKNRAKIVSYFYNVILLQFRANQNRTTPDEINSDTDDVYYKSVENDAPTTTAAAADTLQKASALLSPKKQRRR